LSPRILLLEDDPAIAGTVAFALQREGFWTSACPTAAAWTCAANGGSPATTRCARCRS